jgi:hypothetical protein
MPKMHFMALQNAFQNQAIDFKGKTLGSRPKSDEIGQMSRKMG